MKIARGIYCEDCIHFEECEARNKALGIVTYVSGKRDCIWYQEIVKLKVKLDNFALQPERAHADDAGLDLKTPVPFWLHQGDHVKIDTGVHVQIPKGYVGLITSKSRLMEKGITSRGTIDSGYTGSIQAVLYNHGKEGIPFEAGQKITQLVLVPCITPEIEYVEELEHTERGSGGFGSTGI